ncbi:hypothetical protein TWF696_008503 [Orbilia brochopaga]|uniref:Uncharacterized protein n=1 Tax=Orbilia brochopaga TaxID=3140254 RepID=A0AAV9UG55_9PEZI
MVTKTKEVRRDLPGKSLVVAVSTMYEEPDMGLSTAESTPPVIPTDSDPPVPQSVPLPTFTPTSISEAPAGEVVTMQIPRKAIMTMYMTISMPPPALIKPEVETLNETSSLVSEILPVYTVTRHFALIPDKEPTITYSGPMTTITEIKTHTETWASTEPASTAEPTSTLLEDIDTQPPPEDSADSQSQEAIKTVQRLGMEDPDLLSTLTKMLAEALGGNAVMQTPATATAQSSASESKPQPPAKTSGNPAKKNPTPLPVTTPKIGVVANAQDKDQKPDPTPTPSQVMDEIPSIPSPMPWPSPEDGTMLPSPVKGMKEPADKTMATPPPRAVMQYAVLPSDSTTAPNTALPSDKPARPHPPKDISQRPWADPNRFRGLLQKSRADSNAYIYISNTSPTDMQKNDLLTAMNRAASDFQALQDQYPGRNISCYVRAQSGFSSNPMDQDPLIFCDPRTRYGLRMNNLNNEPITTNCQMISVLGLWFAQGLSNGVPTDEPHGTPMSEPPAEYVQGPEIPAVSDENRKWRTIGQAFRAGDPLFVVYITQEEGCSGDGGRYGTGPVSGMLPTSGSGASSNMNRA